jgi:hypothetical protein
LHACNTLRRVGKTTVCEKAAISLRDNYIDSLYTLRKWLCYFFFNFFKNIKILESKRFDVYEKKVY